MNVKVKDITEYVSQISQKNYHFLGNLSAENLNDCIVYCTDTATTTLDVAVDCLDISFCRNCHGSSGM